MFVYENYLLWSFIRDRKLDGYKFRRQQIIQGFIVDFVCYEKKFIIELDGEHHAEQEEQDAARTKKLQQDGFQVFRFWNKDVLSDISLILENIRYALKKHPSSALRAPSPTRGEGECGEKF